MQTLSQKIVNYSLIKLIWYYIIVSVYKNQALEYLSSCLVVAFFQIRIGQLI